MTRAALRRTNAFVFGLLTSCLPAAAGEENGDKLVYSVNRVPEPPFETARPVVVLTREDIHRRNARNLPELLVDVAGVFLQQTNYGGGSPIIRGLAGKQILIFVDGVRINNTTFRHGFLQYLNTIDLGMVERIEIVRGAESVLASDSLGGVINVVTKRGPLAGDGDVFGAGLTGRVSSADAAASGRAEAFGRCERFRFLAGATYRRSGDVSPGGDGAIQREGYDEAAGDVSLDLFLTADKTLSAAYRRFEQHHVPRGHLVAEGTNRVFEFDPQRLQLVTVKYQDLTSRPWADAVKLTLSWNRQEEGRREIRVASPNVERKNLDGNDLWAVNLELATVLGASQRLVWGGEYTWEDITSTRTDRTLSTGALARRRGRYTDGATYGMVALYAQDRVDVGSRLELSLGLRYADHWASGQEATAVGGLDLESRFRGLTGSANATLKLSPRLHVIGSVNRGFRAPNVDDLSVFDERRDGTEIPNPDAAPERSLTLEGGLKYRDDRLEGSAFYYRNELRDLLVRSPGTFGGLPFFDVNGNGRRDAAEPPVLQKKNMGTAVLTGLELDLSWRPCRQATVFGNFTRTVGDDESLDEPLPRIPPPFGVLGVRWTAASGRRPWIEAVYRFARPQRRLSAVDVADTRVGPGGTGGYHVVDVRGGLSLGRRLRTTLAMENLLDQRYKYHGSGIYRPGFQIVFGADLQF